MTEEEKQFEDAYLEEEIQQEKMLRQKCKEERLALSKPSLFRRLGAGLIDLLCILLVSCGLFFLFQNTYMKADGNYFDQLHTVQSLYDDSGLYKRDGSAFNELEYDYDVMDKAITNYYTNDAYAIEVKALDEFNKSKENHSELFKKQSDGSFTLVVDKTSKLVKDFYDNQYKNAKQILSSNPLFVQANKKSFSIMVWTIFFTLLLSTCIFYFLIPVFRNDGATLGQLLLKLQVIDARNNQMIKKWQQLIRYFVIVLFNLLIPTFLVFLWNISAFIPLLVSILIMCITKENRSLHCIVSQTVVVNAIPQRKKKAKELK